MPSALVVCGKRAVYARSRGVLVARALELRRRQRGCHRRRGSRRQPCDRHAGGERDVQRVDVRRHDRVRDVDVDELPRLDRRGRAQLECAIDRPRDDPRARTCGAIQRPPRHEIDVVDRGGVGAARHDQGRAIAGRRERIRIDAARGAWDRLQRARAIVGNVVRVRRREHDRRARRDPHAIAPRAQLRRGHRARVVGRGCPRERGTGDHGGDLGWIRPARQHRRARAVDRVVGDRHREPAAHEIERGARARRACRC